MYFNINQDPTAFVSVGRNRLRVYHTRSVDKVFMNDSNEFEIELFNPKNTPILAKIKLNSEYISHGGIVLNPGERVFLERYLETDRKFKFSTYEVDTNNDQVKKAIQHNGKVEVEFYDEYQQSNYPYWSSNITLTHTGNWWDNKLTTFSGQCTGSASSTPKTFYNKTVSTSQPTSATYSCDSNSTLDFMQINEVADMNLKLEETGRVSEGNKSDQAFTYVDKQFNTFYCKRIEYQIMPMSQKEKYNKSDIRVYCTSCGTRRRKDSWKFCPKCGASL